MLLNAAPPEEVFNYLSVVTSIIMGIGLTHLLTSVSILIKADGDFKKKHDTLYIIWVVSFFLLYLIYWWAYWDYRSEIQWNFIDFIILLMGPAGLYIATDVLVFTKEDTSKTSFEHFQKNRVLFFSILIGLQIWGILIRPILTGNVSLHAFTDHYKVRQYFVILMTVLGLRYKNKKLQYFVAILLLVELSSVVFSRFTIDRLISPFNFLFPGL